MIMKKTKKILLVMIVVSFLVMPVAGRLLIEKEEPSFQVRQSTDKLIYRRGDPVQISFENNEVKILYLPETPPWEIWKFDFRSFQWKSTIDPPALQIIDPVLPGGIRSYTWNQQDSEGEQVSWGVYRVDIPYSESLLMWELIISHSIFIIL
jgi:hypothetical protein